MLTISFFFYKTLLKCKLCTGLVLLNNQIDTICMTYYNTITIYNFIKLQNYFIKFLYEALFFIVFDTFLIIT